MSGLDPRIVDMMKQEVVARVKELLEQKHLYQSVKIETSGALEFIKDYQEKQTERLKKNQTSHAAVLIRQVSTEAQVMSRTVDYFARSCWAFRTDSCHQRCLIQGTAQDFDATTFLLPTINIRCQRCEAVLPPHNSGFRNQESEFPRVDYNYEKISPPYPMQTFFFPYQCQSCKQEPLIFLVHREGMRLKLAGRNHFETVDVPKTIPSTERKYYSDAVVAYNTGNILAGTFLLRTLIEQYMRRILETKVRTTGEDLADEYAKLLDVEFPKKYPSLKVIYEELSAKIHDAAEDVEQFKKSRGDIERHFRLLQDFPLRTPPSK